HRRDAQGRGTAALVDGTMRRLMNAGKEFSTITVVRPDTLKDVPHGLIYLHGLGVRHVNLSLDLWTNWTAIDGLGLQALVDRAAELWRQWLPDFSLNWFDGKVAHL